MPSPVSETDAAVRSCWTPDHRLRHCERYLVWEEAGPIGYVAAVLRSEDDGPHSLMVRVGSSFSVLVIFPVEAVEGLDSATERAFVGATAPSSDCEEGQLRIPAFA